MIQRERPVTQTGLINSWLSPGPPGPTVPPSHFLSTSEQKGDSLDFRRHWQAPASTEVLDSPLLCAVGRDSSTGNLCFESASVALRPRIPGPMSLLPSHDQERLRSVRVHDRRSGQKSRCCKGNIGSDCLSGGGSVFTRYNRRSGCGAYCP